MSRILLLDRAVADRIAAGEVVERPASVVKELVENSLDAGARTITVEIEQAGLRLIRVSDDGGGMVPEDAPLSVQRFATSKIATAEDLERVATYGFRGEALPSIAAVSRLELATRQADAESGTRVSVVGGAPPVVTAAGAAPGTVVTVRDLFFNTPARRKFLKSPAREFALITEAVQRLALAAPEVTFRLRHEGREVLIYPAAAPQERLAQVLGRDLASAMARVGGGSAAPGGVIVAGWAVRPEGTRPARTLDYVSVNSRPIRSRLVSRAVLQGYAELLPVGHFPVAVISLDLDPASLDVNIHPRKLEVRFTDEHRVFATVTRAVREALLGPEALRHIPQAPPDRMRLPEAPGTVAMAAGVAEAVPFYPPGPGPLPPMRLLGQILRTYLVAEVPGGLVLIDQHAAHERILYERLLRDATNGQGSAQMLAVPVPVDLSAAEAGVLDELLPASARLGFTLEPFGGSTLLVRAVPAALVRQPPEAIVRRALAALIEPRDGDEAMQRLAIATACHTAVRAGDVLTAEEMAALLRDLAATEDPFTCFHGRPTMVRVSREALDRWFLRR